MSESRLLQRLADGPLLCAEGYLFELERRGFLQAGAYVPEVVLEHPGVVEQLHREFVHAGSDVVEAFTYYGHREKLRLIGKEALLEPLNRGALAIAAKVAGESGALLAGNVCNTNVFADDEPSRRAVRAMFEEQAAWAADAGVAFVSAETFQFAGEALLALEAIRGAGLDAVVTLAIHREPVTREGWAPEEACRRLADAAAAVVGLNCIRGPRTMLPLLRAVREAVDVPGRPAPAQGNRTAGALTRSAVIHGEVFGLGLERAAVGGGEPAERAELDPAVDVLPGAGDGAVDREGRERLRCAGVEDLRPVRLGQDAGAAGVDEQARVPRAEEARRRGCVRARARHA